MTALVAEVRALAHRPRRVKGLGAEYELAGRLELAKEQGLFSESQVAELEAMPAYDLVADIRASGWGRDMAEVAMADPLRWAKRRGQLSHSHGAGQPVLKVPRTGSERLTPESGLSLARSGASQPASSQR